jgi:hypothetical protein
MLMNKEAVKNRRKEMKDNKSYKDGFDYAAGSILRKEKTPYVLDSEQTNDSPFDKGMNDAIRELVRLGLVKDDRI